MNRFFLGILISLLIAIIVGGAVLILRLHSGDYPVEITLPPVPTEITVHVTGEVKEPGLYSLDEGARVADAVEAAGGFTKDANPASVNLARGLRDGNQVQVFKRGASDQRININTAPAWLLDTLEGIGPAIAEKIIEYRYQNGPFESVDDLKNVKGIGDSLLEKIRDKITVH